VRKSASKFSGPVRVAPYPVDRDPIAPTTPTERAAARAQLGLGEHTFCVGYSFSAASNFERKNPEGVVAAFQQAFPSGDADASLLLRALDLDIFPAGAKRLRAAAAADPRIRIFEAAGETLSLRSFYSAIDVYLAPFRSEGFGLNLVEASQAGIPVVASGYGVDEAVSAHPGIHLVSWRLVPVRERQGHYVDVKGACWAEPDMGEISVALRALRTGRR
jgi:glycosyltransferase involved in cell wall biosynthesis